LKISTDNGFMNKKIQANSNILLVANYRSDIGYAWWLMENFWSEISVHFLKSGRKCTLIYPKINSIPDVIKKSPITLIEQDFSDKSFRSIVKLLRIIKQNKIGFVYLTDRAYYDWLYLLMKIFGVRRIVNHDHTPGELPRPPFYKKAIKKMIHFLRLFSCDHYIGVSKFVKKRAIESACISEKKCSYIHNGLKLFDNSRSTYAHDTFNIPKGSKIIVTTGRATFYKGIDVLIKCANILINEKGFKSVYFLYVGNGPDLQKFKDMAVELRVDKKFVFAGFRNDISKILPSCDIGLQVSLGEAFSLSILEYMCAGLATLAPDNCGNSEAIEDGVNGILFQPGEVTDIVEKITILLNNQKISQKIKKKVRESVVENFTIEVCNRKIISLLKKQFV